MQRTLRTLLLRRSNWVRHMSSDLETWNVLQADTDKTSIQGYDRFGFNVNGIFMRGSVICFPTFTLLWDAQSIQDATPESLAPVYMVKPRISVLLIGTGEEMHNVNPLLYGWLSRRGVAVENMSSKDAISTFNVLNTEDRGVAAALLSLEPVSREDGSYYVMGERPATADQTTTVSRGGGEEDEFERWIRRRGTDRVPRRGGQ